MTHHPQKYIKKQQRFEALNDNEPEATSTLPPEEQPPASSLKVKKSIKKDTENKEILPGQIGIQRLRELLEDAKINKS